MYDLFCDDRINNLNISPVICGVFLIDRIGESNVVDYFDIERNNIFFDNSEYNGIYCIYGSFAAGNIVAYVNKYNGTTGYLMFIGGAWRECSVEYINNLSNTIDNNESADLFLAVEEDRYNILNMTNDEIINDNVYMLCYHDLNSMIQSMYFYDTYYNVPYLKLVGNSVEFCNFNNGTVNVYKSINNNLVCVGYDLISDNMLNDIVNFLELDSNDNGAGTILAANATYINDAVVNNSSYDFSIIGIAGVLNIDEDLNNANDGDKYILSDDYAEDHSLSTGMVYVVNDGVLVEDERFNRLKEAEEQILCFSSSSEICCAYEYSTDSFYDVECNIIGPEYLFVSAMLSEVNNNNYDESDFITQLLVNGSNGVMAIRNNNINNNNNGNNNDNVVVDSFDSSIRGGDGNTVIYKSSEKGKHDFGI